MSGKLSDNVWVGLNVNSRWILAEQYQAQPNSLSSASLSNPARRPVKRSQASPNRAAHRNTEAGTCRAGGRLPSARRVRLTMSRLE
jgi:hypothetical protein